MTPRYAVSRVSAAIYLPDGHVHPGVAIMTFVASSPLEVAIHVIDLSVHAAPAVRELRLPRAELEESMSGDLLRLSDSLTVHHLGSTTRFALVEGDRWVDIDIHADALEWFLAEAQEVCPIGSVEEQSAIDAQIERVLEAFGSQR